MSFKRFLIWSSGSPPVRCNRTIYAILKEGIMGNIHVSYMEFGPVVQKENSFKDISYLELWQPPCSVDIYHLCNIGRRHHEEQFCEIILTSGQWFRRRCCLKDFLIWSSGSPPVWCNRTIYAILIEGIMGNIHVKLYKIWTCEWFKRELV